LEQKGLTRLLDEIGAGGRRSVMYCKGGGRNAEPHIGVEVQICEGRSGIPPLGLFGKRENPMHKKTFILAGIALIGSGISSAISGPCTVEIDGLTKTLASKIGADGWRDGSGKCADRLFGAASPNRGHGSGDPGQGNFFGRRSSPNPG
jgi:hypothetical protein